MWDFTGPKSGCRKITFDKETAPPDNSQKSEPHAILLFETDSE
jgi:hypothetical protein